jgi:hypothetical protein
VGHCEATKSFYVALTLVATKCGPRESGRLHSGRRVWKARVKGYDAKSQRTLATSIHRPFNVIKQRAHNILSPLRDLIPVKEWAEWHVGQWPARCEGMQFKRHCGRRCASLHCLETRANCSKVWNTVSRRPIKMIRLIVCLLLQYGRSDRSLCMFSPVVASSTDVSSAFSLLSVPHLVITKRKRQIGKDASAREKYV